MPSRLALEPVQLEVPFVAVLQIAGHLLTAASTAEPTTARIIT